MGDNQLFLQSNIAVAKVDVVLKHLEDLNKVTQDAQTASSSLQ